MSRLENWEIIDFGGNMIAFGNVYDDSRANEEYSMFVDGNRIRTSKIVEVDPNRKWIQTRNTRYMLGLESDHLYVDFAELMLIMDDINYKED